MSLLPPNPAILFLDIIKIIASVLTGRIGKRLIKSVTSSGTGYVTVYQCPAGHRAFITACWLSQITEIGSTHIKMQLHDVAGNVVGSLLEMGTFSSGINSQISNQFPSPVKLEPGEKITIIAAYSSTSHRAGIIGWEE